MQPLTGFRNQASALSPFKTRIASEAFLKGLEAFWAACGKGKSRRLSKLLFQELMKPLLTSLNVGTITFDLKRQSLLQWTKPPQELLQLLLSQPPGAAGGFGSVELCQRIRAS